MSIFTCCEREDETKYIHTCGCPNVELITSSQRRNLSLCGHSEYGSTPSNPPKKYLTETETVIGGSSNGIVTKYTCESPYVKVSDQCYRIDDEGNCRYYSEDFTDCNFTQSTFCDGDNFFTTCITGPKYERDISVVEITSGFTSSNYVDTRTYDSSTCQPTTVRTGAGTVYTPQQGDLGQLCPDGDTSSLGQGYPVTFTDVTPEFTDTNTAKQIGSRIEKSYGSPFTRVERTSYQGVYSGSGCISEQTFTGAGNQTVTNGTLKNFELSNEDTEENALNRSQLINGTLSYSSIGIRGASYNDDPFSWIIQSAQYALLFKNLFVGNSYQSGGLPFASAEIGEAYEEETNIPIPTFTATDTFHIIGGTLNVTPEEFKENNFSLNPSAYIGLSSGDLVITPTENVQEADGYKYRVRTGSFGSEPDLYIELEQS